MEEHQAYLLSIPYSYEILQKWHPAVHVDYINHLYDNLVNSLIIGSPWIPPPDYVYWTPEEEFDCNRKFNRTRDNDIFTISYPIVTTLEPRTPNDSLIALKPHSKVMYFDGIILLPIQSFTVWDSSWVHSNEHVKALFLVAF